MGKSISKKKVVIMQQYLKVAIVTNSLSGGGAEISMMRLFKSLLDSKFDVALCAINVGDEDDKSKTEGMYVVGRDWGAGALITVKNLLRFRRFLRTHKFNTLIVNCELPELYVSLVSPLSCKIIAVEHTSRPWNGRRLLGFVVRLLLMFKGTQWVTVSSNQREVWPNRQEALYIPNPHVPALNRKLEKSSDLVFVGRLNRGKRPELAAQAARATGSTIAFLERVH